MHRARAAVRRAKGLHLPGVQVFGDCGGRSGSDFDQSEFVWSSGVSVSVNLFSGGGISAGVRENEARLIVAEEKLRETLLKARMEAEEALSSLREGRGRQELAARVTETAAESYRIEEIRYNTGAGMVSELLLVHSAWAQAQANELLAVYDQQRAHTAWLLAVGRIDSILPAKRSEES